MNDQYRNISLRQLEEKDCDYILEWMNDKEITSNLKLSDLHIQRNDILNFIENSINDSSNKHFALVFEDDEYLGTISLKT
jgi:diamine N-acetyltransferase